MKHIWSVLCQKSLIDSDTNNISLIDCLEEIQFAFDRANVLSGNKQDIPISFHLISLWGVEKEDRHLEIKIEILDPDEQVLNISESKFSVKKDSLRFRSRIIFNKLPITRDGRYIFKIWQKKKKKYELVSELPLDIKISYKINTLKRN